MVWESETLSVHKVGSVWTYLEIKVPTPPILRSPDRVVTSDFTGGADITPPPPSNGLSAPPSPPPHRALLQRAGRAAAPRAFQEPDSNGLSRPPPPPTVRHAPPPPPQQRSVIPPPPFQRFVSPPPERLSRPPPPRRRATCFLRAGRAAAPRAF